MSKLIDFYSGVGADHRSRKIDEIIAWDDQRLEQTHDYIQWLPWAQALFAALEELYRDHSAVIGSLTFGIWRRAVNESL